MSDCYFVPMKNRHIFEWIVTKSMQIIVNCAQFVIEHAGFDLRVLLVHRTFSDA